MADNNKRQLLPMETPSLFGTFKYKVAMGIMENQQDSTWTSQEIPVEDDKHDFLITMSTAQRKVTDSTLGLFVEIEQEVGEIWNTIASWYPHAEIEGACLEMARMEKSVHAFFYQKMSDVLNIAPEDTAKIQNDVTVLKNKLNLLKKITCNPSANKPLTLATLAIIEQVLLFSNFAMLKSFKSNGHNLMKNTLLGVDYVIDDEQLHGVLAAYLHNTHVEEDSNIDLAYHRKDIVAVITEVIAHEDAVIDYTFEGEIAINSVKPKDLKIFIRSRANDVLSELNLSPMFTITSNPVAAWFYKGTKAIKIHDFFSAGTTQYSKNWNITGFSMLPFLKAQNGK